MGVSIVVIFYCIINFLGDTSCNQSFKNTAEKFVFIEMSIKNSFDLISIINLFNEIKTDKINLSIISNTFVVIMFN
jgi:hypothetical protein